MARLSKHKSPLIITKLQRRITKIEINLQFPDSRTKMHPFRAACTFFFFFLVNKDVSVGVVFGTREQCGADEAKGSAPLLQSCHSLLEKAGGFIKPLNPAESAKSWRQHQPPPRRRPEVRAESLGAPLGLPSTLGVIQIY